MEHPLDAPFFLLYLYNIMNKKYNKKVIQYNIHGDKINEFDNAKEASHIVNYDSIIGCCKFKYKTAGGFVWRFEGDNFSLENNKSLKGPSHTCKICSSNETIRSMSSHLKWVHNIKTEDYIKLYGEYRPKFLENTKAKNQSNIKCYECGDLLLSNQHLMYHISKKHPEITKSEYIIKYLLNGDTPLCKCGCGTPVVILENGKNCDLGKETYHRDYIKGHWDWPVFSNISKQSKEEIELVNFIKSIYPDEILTNVKNILPKSEIDIYLPKLKIGIEYNGLYWHSEKAGRYKDYHLTKYLKCQAQDIRLIQIFSDEWINKNSIVKTKLQSILNQIKNRVYARKCIIQEISSQDKNKFLNKFHIQGEDRSSIKLGMFYENELVGVMTFSSPRLALGQSFNNPGVYELSRFATSCNIIGGASKLLKYFINKYNPEQIYSYSDNRWTDPNNNMYLKIGFSKISSSSPSYFYTKDFLTRIHRFNFNKINLKKLGIDIENRTESQIMEELKYTKIWDCGTTKYILHLPKTI